MPLAVAAYSIWVLVALFSNFSLYADGAHEFLRVLEAQNFVPFWWSRHFSFYIYQFPLVLALKLGVTSLPALRFALGLGCFLPWVLALLLCRWISRENFWLAVMGCAAGYLNGAYMPVGQHTIAHALFWPALFVLLFARPLKTSAALVLLATATGLQFSYESQVFLCAPLLALSVWRLFQKNGENANLTRLIFLTAAALFLLSILNGIYSLLMPEIPANLIGFKIGTLRMFQQPGWTLTWTVLFGGVAAAACLSEKIWRFLSGKSGFYLGATTVLIWGFWPLLAPDRLDTGIQYDNRSVNLFVPLALLPVGLILSFRPSWLASRRERLTQFAAVLLLAQSFWHISCACLWYRDTVSMRQVLVTQHGLYPLHYTMLEKDGMLGRLARKGAIGGRFDWSWPCLSIALSPSKQIGCLICSEIFLEPNLKRQCWQPFDPMLPATLPNLARYGIDFTNYTTILQKQLAPD